MFYALINKYSPKKISYVQWFDEVPTSPMEFDGIESCYDLDDWKIVKVVVTVDKEEYEASLERVVSIIKEMRK